MADTFDDTGRYILITGFEAYTNTDLTEGKGGHVHIGYFVNEDDARVFIQGMGVMGGNADVRSFEFKVFETARAFAEHLIDGPVRTGYVAARLGQLAREHLRALDAEEYAEFQRLKKKFGEMHEEDLEELEES